MVQRKLPPRTPEWYPLTSKAYPNSTYLSARNAAGAESAEAAMAQAANTLAGFIKTEVASELSRQMISEEKTVNGKTTGTTETVLKNQITSKVNVDLVALEYADPYYNKSDKSWYACAYIEKAKAYEALKPELENEKSAFYGIYDKAIAEKEPFAKIRLLNSSRKQSGQFKTKLAYAELFAPDLVAADFGADKKAASEISAQISEIIIKTPIYVTVKNDTDDAVKSALVSVLTSNGYTVSDALEKSACPLSASINYNESTQDDGTGNTIYINTPSLSVNLSDAGSKKAVYSFTVQGKSARSYNRATVKNIASKSISAAVKDEFAKDFSNFMGIESASADILSLFGL
ncbi:MAG: LPP20 family lipoprotein [Treponema sp.]|nr:LPP20 family lipoprotein [Spirochaetales bacterium]MDY5812497.1 LPP20 family lipoprotein [Treponema sp.]